MRGDEQRREERRVVVAVILLRNVFLAALFLGAVLLWLYPLRSLTFPNQASPGHK